MVSTSATTRKLSVPAGWLLAVLLLAVAGLGLSSEARDKSTAPPDPDNLPPEMTMTLEQLLNDPEGIVEETTTSRCINSRIATQTEILDEEHLIFRSGVGKRVWLNRLGPGCIGLKPDMVLILQSRGASACRLDTVYGMPRSTLVGSFSTGRCSLGDFEPITPQHADALIESFKMRGKDLAEARKKERREAREERRRKRREAREAKRAAAASAS